MYILFYKNNGQSVLAQAVDEVDYDLDDHRRKLEYDLYFIRERSTRLYLLTLLRTVSAALVGVRDTQGAAASPKTARKAPPRAATARETMRRELGSLAATGEPQPVARNR